MWPKDGNSPAANNGATITQDGATTFTNQLNITGGFAGHADWRVPNYKELASIIDYDKSAPTAYSAFINIKPGKYWSNSRHLYWDRGWYIDFSADKLGIQNYTPPDSPYYYFLPVRGPITTTTLQETGISGDTTGCTLGFQDNGTTTKTDLCTGLMWTNTLTGVGYSYEGSPEDGVSFQRAELEAQQERFGYSDWRLPNVRELVNVSKILSATKERYWTATLSYADPEKIWYVTLRTNPGKAQAVAKTQSYYIKLVRGVE